MKSRIISIMLCGLVLLSTFFLAGELRDSDVFPNVDANGGPWVPGTCDYQTFHNDYTRSGFSECTGSLYSAYLKWTHLSAEEFIVGSPRVASPAIADVDGDGLQEIIAMNGYHLVKLDGSTGLLEATRSDIGVVTSSPSVGDLNSDGSPEIVIGGLHGTSTVLYALRGQDLQDFWSPLNLGEIRDSTPALHDLNDDGHLDIVVGSQDSHVYALNGLDGSTIWQFQALDEKFQSSPAIVDVDNDMIPEVVIMSIDENAGGHLYVLTGTSGSEERQIALGTLSPIRTMAVGNLDADADLEIIVPAEDQVIALDLDEGNYFDWIWNYPISDPTSPAIANIDWDPNPEVVFIDNEGTFIALDGTNGMFEWDYETGGVTTESNALSLADIDNDGIVEAIGGGVIFTHGLYAVKLGVEQWSLGPIVNSHAPSIGDVDGDGEVEVVVSVFSGQRYRVSCYDRGGSIEGTVWIDEPPYGSKESEEGIVNGVPILLYQMIDNVPVYKTMTYSGIPDGDGRYYFTDLEPGVYQIMMGYKECWEATYPPMLPFVYRTVVADETAVADFGVKWICAPPNYPSFSVSLVMASQGEFMMGQGDIELVEFRMENHGGSNSIVSFLTLSAVIEDYNKIKFFEDPHYLAHWKLQDKATYVTKQEGDVFGTVALEKFYVHTGGPDNFPPGDYMIATWHLPLHIELRWDESLWFGFEIKAYDVGDSRLQLFARSTEDHHPEASGFKVGVPLPEIQDKANLFMETIQGKWFAAHNSLDPYDHQDEVGVVVDDAHVWNNWEWVPIYSQEGGFGYAKANMKIHVV